jgi:protein-tyrosine-phosphatase
MAEAFARTYGSDVLEASSAGIYPSVTNSSVTRTVLREKNIDLGDHMPRSLVDVNLDDIDLIVNMSGQKLPSSKIRVEDWPVQDPYGANGVVYRKVAGEIEMLVMRLILRIRAGKI